MGDLLHRRCGGLFVVLTAVLACRGAPATPPAPMATDAASAVVAHAPAPTFERLDYEAVYHMAPLEALTLTVLGTGAATLRFGGNTDSPLFPQRGPAQREARLSPARLEELLAALAAAAIDTLPSDVGSRPTATARITVVRDGRRVQREYPLYSAPDRWRPVADVLHRVVGELLGPIAG